MAPVNAWTDERIDDFMERYRTDRAELKEQLGRIENKLDGKRWSPAVLTALLGPVGVSLIGAVAMVMAKGGG